MKTLTAPSLILGAALLVSGCSSLDSTTVVKSNFAAEDYTAKLKFAGDFEVVSINGRPENTRKFQEQMRLVPGTHEVGVIAREYNLEGSGTIGFTVAEGQTLELSSQRDGVQIIAVIRDAASGDTIASYPLEVGTPDSERRNRAANDTNGNQPLG